jgi:protein tyrosine/serine phosphatase
MRAIKVDDRVWRGERPRTADDFAYLADQGIKTILNVEGGLLENLSADPNYQQTMAFMAGMEQVRIGMSALWAPSRGDVNTCLAVLARSVAQPQLYGPVYVHCHQGVDRTGFVIAAYRLRYYDWKYGRAVAEMLRLGFHRWYRYWLPALRHWENVR